MTNPVSIARLALLLVLAAGGSAGAAAAEIKVLASAATKEVMDELFPPFEKSTGHKVTVVFTDTPTIRKRIAAGEAFDLVIVGAPVVDGFIQQGKVVPGSRVDFMKSGLGVAVRAGAPRPDVGTSAGLKNALLGARAIGYSSGASGEYVPVLVEKLGVTEQVKPKLKQAPSGTRVGMLLANGEVDLGLQQISELINEKGIDYLGPLPADVQNVIVLSAGLPATGTETDAARALVKALKDPGAGSAMKKHGMEPG